MNLAYSVVVAMAKNKEALLKEYESCQRHNHHVANHYWLITGIFMSVNTAIMGGITISIISGSMPANWAIRLVIGIVVALFGLGIVYILHRLKLYLRRVNFHILFNYERMRDIESELGMWSNWRVFGVDRWDEQKQDFNDEVLDDIRQTLLQHRAKAWWQRWKASDEYMAPVGQKGAELIMCTLMSLWGIFVVAVWVILLLSC